MLAIIGKVANSKIADSQKVCGREVMSLVEKDAKLFTAMFLQIAAIRKV